MTKIYQERLSQIESVSLKSGGHHCQCGCGRQAPQYQRTNATKGHVRGAYAPYVSGHNKRGSTDLTRYVLAESGCWIWTGSVDHKGYGRCQVQGMHTHAHREVYREHGGQIPEGMHLDHLCRNKLCVNPEHMEPVTPAENVRRQHAARRLQASALELIRRMIAAQ